MKKIKLRLALLLGALLCGAPAAYAAESYDGADKDGKTYAYGMTDTKEGDSSNPSEYGFDFDEELTVKDKDYKLNHVEFDVISKYELEYGDVEIPGSIEEKQTVKADEKDDFKPETDKIEQDGFTYELSDVDMVEVEKKAPLDMETHTDSDITMAEVSAVSHPDTMEYDKDGKTYELPYKDYEVFNEGWHSGYSLTGTIYNYDAATYKINGMVMDADALQHLNSDGVQQLLVQMGYSADVYRGEAFSFTSEPYLNEKGIAQRDYRINVSIYGRQYRFIYGQEKDMSTYEAVMTYEMSQQDAATIASMQSSYVVTANAFYDVVEKVEKKSSLSTTTKVAIAFGVLLGVAVFIALFIYLIRGGRKDTDYRSKRDSKRDYKNL